MKQQYRIRNWFEYNAGLKQGGSLTFWVDEAVLGLRAMDYPRLEWSTRSLPLLQRPRDFNHGDAESDLPSSQTAMSRVCRVNLLGYIHAVTAKLEDSIRCATEALQLSQDSKDRRFEGLNIY